jgi:hypothetical protein
MVLPASSLVAMFPCAANDDSDRWYGYYEVRMAECGKKSDPPNTFVETHGSYGRIIGIWSRSTDVSIVGHTTTNLPTHFQKMAFVEIFISVKCSFKNERSTSFPRI